MSFNDFAVQLYLTILAIAAAPIVLSWMLRRVAGNAAGEPPAAYEAERREAAAREKAEEDSYWYQYDMGMLPESPHD
jgi:hypothetical protein